MAGINIAFFADVTDFLRGAGKAEDALDDVGGALDDMADEAKQQGKAAGDGIERGVEDGAGEAADAVGKLEKSFADMARDASRYSKDAGSDLGTNVRRGTDDAESGLQSFRDEANSTARETAASFDGSADSIAGAFQEVAANALGGFGPIGAAAGLALAAGVGKFWTEFQADAERAKQATADAFEDMIESGSKFLSAELINQRIRDIVTGGEDAATSWENVEKVAAKSGAEISLVLRAYAGDQEAVNALIDAANAKSQEIKDRYEGGVLSDAAREDRAELARLVSSLEGVQATTDEAAQRATEYGRAARHAGDEAVDGAARARAEYDGLGRKISEIPTERTVTVKVQADTRDAQRQIKAFTDGSYAVTVKGRVTGMRYE